jgi:ubiquitin carboxyl-terminal hydrolase 4/11/15
VTDQLTARKKIELWQAPEVLVVHLKRFAFSAMWRTKIDDRVDFPLTGLDLSSYVQDHVTLTEQHTVAPVYDLFAVSVGLAQLLCRPLLIGQNHYGGMGGGHYTAMAYHSDLQQWFHFDDASVHPIAADEVASTVVSPAAYILFYKRRKDTCQDLYHKP